jgi:flagellin
MWFFGCCRSAIGRQIGRVCMVSNASSVQQAALTSQRILSANIEATNKSASRIATGRRIQNASDGAAELQQIERLSSQINGSQKALEATQDTSNVLNIADGALGSQGELLQRARELTVQAANDTNGPEQRAAIQGELDQITQEIDRIGNTTSFNGRQLLDGSQTSFNAVTDANGGGIDIADAFGDSRSAALGTNALSVSDSASARNSLDSIDTALSRVNNQRSQIGAFQNRLEATGSNLEIQSVNSEGARSRLRDTDFASEVTKFTSKKIQSQASTSVLAQTNRLSSGIMSLING